MPHIWNTLLAQLPAPHFLQTYEWGQVKARYGWQPFYLIWTETDFIASQDVSFVLRPSSSVRAVCLLLKKPALGNRLSVLYAPKGPLLRWEDAPLRKRVLDDLQTFARQHGAIFLKLDPDVVLGRGIPQETDEITETSGGEVRSDLLGRGWQFSAEQIQFKNSVLLDVSPSEEEMLARMKQKTRYNVRLAEKKGVKIRVVTKEDWHLLYQMYAETSLRDGFVIRDENYYRCVWETFSRSPVSPSSSPNEQRDSRKAGQPDNRTTEQPLAEPLIAEVDGEPVAALVLFAFAGRAYYVYGMSRAAHREKMPTYLLQWEAMKWAQAHGCAVYDLWGAPDVFDESDSMWGVFRFKEGLGGEVVRTLGAWDYVPNRALYALYTNIMPRLLDILRSIGRRKTKLSTSSH
jgi:peptidoglycan pentaglycine glycine transferase (the first glycine)